jgi:transposase
LSLHKIFNYILHVLYTGCQWKMLPIERNAEGLPEIHHTRIYRAMQRWQAEGFIDQISSRNAFAPSSACSLGRIGFAACCFASSA